MDARSWPDAEVIERLREGVRIMALSALGSADAAEEVVQETFARTLAALEADRISDRRKLPAFVHGIARHVIADLHRSRPRMVPLTERVEAASGVDEVDPLDALISAEQWERVRRVLEDLPRRDQEILRLSFFDGLTPTEIAKLQGVPPPTIRKQKSRALERLRRAFSSSGHARGRWPTIREEGETIRVDTEESEQPDRDDRGRSR